MTMVTVLEQLAGNAQYDQRTNELIANLPENIKNSFLTNDSEGLKKQLSSDSECFANSINVVHIHL